MKSVWSSIGVFALSILSLSGGNLLLKVGMVRYAELTAAGASGLLAVCKSPQLPLGTVLLAAQFFGMLTLFKWGWDASVVVTIFGLNYVVTALLGRWFLAEPVGGLRWSGIILVLVGIAFIALSVTPAKTP
jgi:drug/metabolite transporter (DMT)-like permease